jgi:hypothetical protein
MHFPSKSALFSALQRFLKFSFDSSDAMPHTVSSMKRKLASLLIQSVAYTATAAAFYLLFFRSQL